MPNTSLSVGEASPVIRRVPRTPTWAAVHSRRARSKPSSLSLRKATSLMVCCLVTISARVRSSGSMPFTPNKLPDQRLIWPG